MKQVSSGCKKDFSQLADQQYFYQSKGRYFANKFKYIQTEIYSQVPFKASNLLLWFEKCTISYKTLSSDLYMEKCLKKRLLSFIKKCDMPTIFWPDLATIYYSKKSLKWYEQNGVE